VNNDGCEKSFLTHLKNDTFCRLGKSQVSGVGVFAIVDIPARINPFISFPSKEDFFIDISREELFALDGEIQKYIKDFFAQDSSGNYPVNATGLNNLNISHYVNHSDVPNLFIEDISGLDVSSGLNTFLTKRRVFRGEELTCNYRDFLSVNNNISQFNFLSKKNETNI